MNYLRVMLCATATALALMSPPCVAFATEGAGDGFVTSTGQADIELNAGISDARTGWVDESGDPCEAADAHRWLDDGIVAASKFFYDPSTDAWYWTDADGSIARGKDAYVPSSNNVDRNLWLTSDQYRLEHGKWVRLGPDGAMVKGESYVRSDVDGQWH